MNVTVATFNTEVLAIQNGTEVVTGSTPITYYDVIEAAGGKYKTKFTATGPADNEIKFVYIVGADGTYSKTYKQAATATGTGTFSYELLIVSYKNRLYHISNNTDPSISI